MSVPIVILHIGNQPYFKNCVLLNAQYNKVIVLGDDSNTDVGTIKNVEHVHVSALGSAELETFRQHFVNYSGNNANYEFLCFARVFYMKRLLELKGLDAIFHTDSDCIVLQELAPIVQEIHKTHTVAYSLEQNANPHHMVGCIHNGLLTSEFCEKFIQLCLDVYVTKRKLHLIQPKINYHRDNKIPGGICDMTLYYLLAKEKLLEVLDLNQLMTIDGTSSAFDHNIFSTVGYSGERTYVIQPNTMKQIEKKDSRYFFVDLEGHRIRALSLHFQGHSKPHMLRVYKSGN